MKIGILTFHRAANYGAVLQAYALQRYLNEVGYYAEIIDYRCAPIEYMHSPHYFLYCKGIKNKCKQLLRSPIKRKKRKLFDSFIERKLKLSNAKEVKKEDVSALNKERYDIIITGSDQVWNPCLTNGDNTYLLDFAGNETRKISYAASFGLSELQEEYKPLYRECLSGFDRISVREIQGQTLIREVVGRDSEVVLDPTLLMEVDEWKKFMKPVKMDKYLLLYTIKQSPILLEKARNIAKDKNLSIIYINDSIVKREGISYVPFATPEEWVGYFAGASHVVTNSFHGTVFSVIFNKSATIALSTDKNNGNSRILDLMHMVGIERQSDTYVELGDITDWKFVNTTLNDLRSCSRKFLDAM